MNLELVERGVALATSARIEIWFAEDDHDLLERVESALEARGTRISTTSSLTEVRRSYDESAAAWSIGLAAFVGAAAVPTVPLFAGEPLVSTLDPGTAWTAVAAAGAALVLGLGSALIGRALARRSDVRRLRETL